ncbi:MAG: gamma-glutamyltransferase [Bacteroidota bacterium]
MKKPFSCFLLLAISLLTTADSAFSRCTRKVSSAPVEAKSGMVVSASGLASKVGVDVLQNGGNAIDAAVAVGFALAVTYPQAGNLGGGGFMIARLADGKTFALDFRERAPHRATQRMYLDTNGNVVQGLSLLGHLASGVPGTVDGLLTALEKFGTKSRREVLSPAITLAKNGFVVNKHLAAALRGSFEEIKKFPSTAKIFTKNGKPYEPGDTLVQTDLARTLERIAEHGRRDFYEGETAKLIVEEMQRGHGLIDEEDLHNYHSVFRDPIRGTYRGYEIISMPPPSAGGIALVEMLNILETFSFAPSEALSSRTIHLMVESMKRAFADRAEYVGDPDFVHVPIAKLISKDYAELLRNSIADSKATPSERIRAGSIYINEGKETTHYSVVDRWGNAVSVTTTLNSLFGSKVVVDGAGFFLNNEMDDFSVKPGTPNQFGLTGGDANAIEPGKRMVSSMTPTIILKNSKPYMVLGSPGGPTIITTVLEVIMNVIDFDMDIQEAVDAPRFHHQWLPDTVFYEHGAFTKQTVQQLKGMGYRLVERRKHNMQGLVEAILIDSNKNLIYGASDRRGDGAAIGY